MTSERQLVVATRPSALARRQGETVRRALEAQGLRVAPEVRVIETTGDRSLGLPLPEIGGKGVFTIELEDALRRGEVDLAVHSLKDLPIESPPGICLAAIPEREDARDVVVARQGKHLSELRPEAMVGSSSLRRQAQLLALRPDLRVEPIRGNVETRVRKVDEGRFDATLLAAAGLIRLGMRDRISEWLSFEVMLPAPGQGALAVQCRQDDRELVEGLAPFDAADTRRAVESERAFLEALGGGCSAPVGAYCRIEGGRLVLDGVVASLDGTRLVRVHGAGDQPQTLGRRLAEQAIQEGAQELLTHA